MTHLLFFLQGTAEDVTIELFGEMIGGIIFLLLLVGVIIWGISKLLGKGK